MAENELQTTCAKEHLVLAPLTINPQSGVDGLEFRTFCELNILHTAVHLINGCFVAVLRHFGCLDWVRKAWRNKLSRGRKQQGRRGFETAASDATQESQSLVFEE